MEHEHKITDANCEHQSAAILAAEGVVLIPSAKSLAGRAILGESHGTVGALEKRLDVERQPSALAGDCQRRRVGDLAAAP